MFYSATSYLKWGKDIPLTIPSQINYELLLILWKTYSVTFFVQTQYRLLKVIHIMLNHQLMSFSTTETPILPPFIVL